VASSHHRPIGVGHPWRGTRDLDEARPVDVHGGESVLPEYHHLSAVWRVAREDGEGLIDVEVPEIRSVGADGEDPSLGASERDALAVGRPVRMLEREAELSLGLRNGLKIVAVSVHRPQQAVEATLITTERDLRAVRREHRLAVVPVSSNH